MKIARKSTRKARVEIIPLIDVTFLLLVFFIYAMLSMTVHRGLPVSLPQATAARVVKDKHIAITVMPDDRLFLDKQAVDLVHLQASLEARFHKNPKMPVLIFGDAKANYQRIMDVLSAIRKSGYTKVSLQSRPKTGPRPKRAGQP